MSNKELAEFLADAIDHYVEASRTRPKEFWPRESLAKAIEMVLTKIGDKDG